MSEEVFALYIRLWSSCGVPQGYMLKPNGSPALVDIKPVGSANISYSVRRRILRRTIAGELIGLGYSVSGAQELLGLNLNDQPKQPGVALTMQDFLDGEWTPSEFVTLYDLVEKLKLHFPDIPDETDD